MVRCGPACGVVGEGGLTLVVEGALKNSTDGWALGAY